MKIGDDAIVKYQLYGIEEKRILCERFDWHIFRKILAFHASKVLDSPTLRHAQKQERLAMNLAS